MAKVRAKVGACWGTSAKQSRQRVERPAAACRTPRPGVPRALPTLPLRASILVMVAVRVERFRPWPPMPEVGRGRAECPFGKRAGRPEAESRAAQQAAIISLLQSDRDCQRRIE